MNINSRIDWEAGMEISAQTFVELDANLARREQVASRAVNVTSLALSLLRNSIIGEGLSVINWRLNGWCAWRFYLPERSCILTKRW